MPRKFVAVESRSAIVAVVLVLASVVPPQVRAQAVSLDPANMPRIGTVDQKARGVTLLVIDADRQRSFDLNLPAAGERYTLTAKQLEDTTVELNGQPLRLTGIGDLPQLEGEPVNAGRVSFAPTSITYFTIANAGNANCQ